MSLLPAVSTTIPAAESGPIGGPTGGPARGSAMGGGPTGGPTRGNLSPLPSR